MNATPSVDASLQDGMRMRRVLMAWAWVALVYFCLGRLGTSFAIEPGYASPIFPAAGFAVAVLLWSGGRAWPGIFLGSFVVNYSELKHSSFQ
jgi:integral membrane sensor domain MASE1